ncbi:MAG TPA: histidine phosphatase family protein [Acidimicrobiia bacterium]|nr:histidine phosphatase family protein [Acidimicrobiia bacterium]
MNPADVGRNESPPHRPSPPVNELLGPRLEGPIMCRALLVPQTGVTELVFVRHGQPERPGPNPTRDDLVDPPLGALGHGQAKLTAAALSAQPLAAVYTSNTRRAAGTAAPIAEAHGLEPVVYPELREFEGFRDVPSGERVRDWVPEALMRGLSERFVRERTWDCFPFSEPGAAFRNRVASAVETIAATHRGERVAIVCHGGVVNAYVAHIWDIRADVVFNAAHASISRILGAGDRRAVWVLNDFHHLAAAGDDHVNY